MPTSNPQVVKRRLCVGLIGLALMLGPTLFAQKEGAVWYFGQNAGLDFNQYYPRPLTDGKINTREGVATICDKDGQLLFYTDGQTVYNRNHEIMANGEGLYGDASSTQSSIVVPKPGSTTEFYIFTVAKAVSAISPNPDVRYRGLNYSVADLSVNGGLGRIVQKNVPMPNTSNVLFTEKITVVKTPEKDYWVIAHQFGTWAFYEFKLTSSGVALINTVNAGSEHRIDLSDRDNRGATGYLKSSPKGDFLATAVEGLKFFELFSFDNRNGDIKVIAKLPAGDNADKFAEKGAAYGVEFSPTSNFLYGSTRKGGILYQWDLNDLKEAAIKNSVQILRQQSGVLCGAMQLGPNGKIYVSLSGQPFLGVVNSPIQKKCNYVEHGASLMDNELEEGGKAYFGLPTFLSDFFKAAEFYYESTCQNDLTKFYLSANKSTIEGMPKWEIFNSNMDFIALATIDRLTMEGTYRFTAAGKYFVKLTVSQFGTDIIQTQEVTIHQLPELNFPDTTSMCKGSPARLDAGDGAFYSWRDNQNLNVERYRNIYTVGEFVVTVTHYNGCSNSDSTMVVEKPLPVIKNTFITRAGCGSNNGSITIEMELATDQYTFEWTLFPDNKTNSATNLPFGVYEVKITSVETGCVLTSKLAVSEENAPAIVIIPSVKGIACAGSKVTLQAGGANEYLWENPDGTTGSTVDVYPWETTTYIVKGYSIDPETGKECSSIGQLKVEVYPYTLPQLGVDRIGCEGDTIRLDGGSGFNAWTWNNNATTRYVEITESIPELIVFATDKNNCLLSDTTSILIKPLPKVELGDDRVQCKAAPIVLNGGTGDKYLWSTSDTIQQISVNESGTYQLTIQKNGCFKTDSIHITIKPLPEVNLGPDSTICASEPITLNGGKGDSYLWSTNETTQDISASETGIYKLTITLDGCENSDEVNLTIKPLPVVDLGQDTIYCKSNPIALSGGTGDAYQWSTDAVTQEILINETGTYYVAITKNGCVSSDTVNIQVNDPALLVIDSVETYPVSCPGNRDGSLKIISHGTGTHYEYSIDDGLHYYSSPWFQGLYGDNQFQIVVREDKACTVKYPKEITFKEPDSIQINYHLVSPSCEECPDGEINLRITGGTPPYSVKWSTNDTVTYLSNMELGKYLVWVTDASKCRENALINLTLDYPPFQIPNAFTPNGDGSNETWKIPALKDFPECEVKLYNRAGKLIWWSETGYPEPWNGVDKSGNVSPVGAYYYLVWLRSDLKPLKGSVSILR